MPIQNPYAGAPARWLKGDIHAHVNKARNDSFAYANGAKATHVYAGARDAKLDFVCMSVEVSSNPGVNRFGDVGTGLEHGVTGIPAREIQNNYFKWYFGQGDSKYLHVLTLGETNGVSLCVHPMYYETANAKAGGEWARIRQALLDAEPTGPLGALNVRGLEIYNAFSFMRFRDKRKLHAYAEFEERCWDDMLMRGRLYWGFAGNDSYYSNAYEFRDIPYLGLVHAAVRKGKAEADVLSALRDGRFYSSTGIELTTTPLTATLDGTTLRLNVEATEVVNWTCHVHRGDVLERVEIDDRAAATFVIADGWKYLRVSCRHASDPWRRAWLQPLTNSDRFGRP